MQENQSKGLKKCICVEFPNCPYLGKIDMGHVNLDGQLYPVKNCDCRDIPLYCIARPIRQPTDRMMLFKIFFREENKKCTFERLSKLAWQYRVTMKNSGKVLGNFLIHDLDKKEITGEGLY